VVEEAAAALGAMRSRGAVSHLADVLRLLDDTELGVPAARALGKIGSRDAEAALVAVLDSARECSEAAAEALGEIGGDEAVAALLRALDRDLERGVGPSVGARALGNLRVRAALPTLERLLKREDAWLSSDAVTAPVSFSPPGPEFVDPRVTLEDLRTLCRSVLGDLRTRFDLPMDR
jgi:HEAT repeat protein